MGKDICKLYDDKELIFKVYKELIKLISNKKTQLKKWAEELNRHLFK